MIVRSTFSILAMLGLGGLATVLTDLANFMRSSWGNKDNQLDDPNVQTIPAGVFTPNYVLTRTDAGTAAMTGITVPYSSFSGRITIIPGGAFTWTNATNIAVAGTAVVNRALDFVYSPVSGKWYPSYV